MSDTFLRLACGFLYNNQTVDSYYKRKVYVDPCALDQSFSWVAGLLQRLSSRANDGPKVSEQFAVSTIQAWENDENGDAINGGAMMVVSI